MIDALKNYFILLAALVVVSAFGLYALHSDYDCVEVAVGGNNGLKMKAQNDNPKNCLLENPSESKTDDVKDL